MPVDPNSCDHDFRHESDTRLHPGGNFMMPATRRCKKCNIILEVADTEMIRSVKSYETLTKASICVSIGALVLSAIAIILGLK